jgi:N-carbamoylputrescine amidase
MIQASASESIERSESFEPSLPEEKSFLGQKEIYVNLNSSLIDEASSSDQYPVAEYTGNNNGIEGDVKRKKTRTRRKSSRVWDHFEVIESNSKTGYNVACRYCDWRIQYSRQSGTSGCNKHAVSTTCPYFSKHPGLGNETNERLTDNLSTTPPAGELFRGSNKFAKLTHISESRGDGGEGYVRVAAIQMPCSRDKQQNILKAVSLVRNAAEQGAQVILLPELFEGVYFCQEQSSQYRSWAHEVNLTGESLNTSVNAEASASTSNEANVTIEENAMYPHTYGSAFIDTFVELAKELHVVLPLSFFEQSNNVYYNSVLMIDANGICLGKYRKSHIPDGPGYQEKFYFSPGDTGFKVFNTTYGKIGVGICWDQWFPEAARAMALQGAEMILYPTAIGSEPQDPTYDSSAHWERTMVGHSAANMIPVVAANRVGIEIFSKSSITFYGEMFLIVMTRVLPAITRCTYCMCQALASSRTIMVRF